ncbi:LPS-assembly protein [Paracoccus sulfuroxidans]|uniref:LPS-assembly protein LptD n=2 Tax=Paracoccus sulfuroxidans TaxID=384678 RepID=A0A562NXR4_9RHOB|nr:LPS-assembly protein [Paracoccus sulfuroxidans]
MAAKRLRGIPGNVESKGRRMRRNLQAAAWMAALPAAAMAQTVVPDGQTVPFYDFSTDSQLQARGPALAPTEQADDNERVADGTIVRRPSSVTRGPGSSIQVTGQPSQQGGAATILADDLTLGADNTITASNGVVIWYQGARLVASRVTYDGTTGAATIDGPIHLTQPGTAGSEDEMVLIADSAQLDRNMQDGILRGARLVLARELQLAARQVRREGEGRFTRLDNVVTSSCRVCAEDPTPLWEIRARSVVHDAQTQQLLFDRPRLRLMGVTVGALPWISAPDPSVERMTGFLRPAFRTTSRLGFGIKLPYFITLGDHADLTVTPYVAASRTRTLELRYRQAFSNGAMEWSGALSRDDIDPDETRGYLFGAARFELPRGYNLSLQVQMASDRAYLLDYDISDADRLWSGVTLDRVRRDRLVWARIGNYESLREDEPASLAPAQVADAYWARRWTPERLGGIANLQWSLHAHRRPSSVDRDGRDMARGSLGLNWQRSEILPGGLVGQVETQVNADFYRIRQDSEYEDWIARAYPTLATELRWPLARHAKGVTQLLEPIIQIVWSPKRESQDKVPNEDSRLIEFDEGNLFSLNRFPGADARESGFRANVGLAWTRIDPAGWSIGLTAGRVFRNTVDTAFSSSGPLGGKSSDWLLAAHYSDSSGLAIANRALFDNSFSISRNELRAGWYNEKVMLSAGYLWMDTDEREARLEDVSELTATAGWQITDGWWGTAETRYDFASDRAQKAEIGMQYRNECVTLEMALERRFTSSDNLTPDTSFDLGIRLGGFGKQKAGPGTVARRACLR